jgi:hypothetical protein
MRTNSEKVNAIMSKEKQHKNKRQENRMRRTVFENY